MEQKVPKLNKNDLTKFNSIKGMQSRKFGPVIWDSLFISILGGYPVKINPRNKEHLKIRKGYILTLSNLKYTLPCSFCRQSYREFYKELPIKKYSYSRIRMCYWLYLLKDKVNNKLIKQELDYLSNLHKEYNDAKITFKTYENLSKDCFMTKPSPPFITVLDKYSIYSATCNKKLKKCLKK